MHASVFLTPACGFAGLWVSSPDLLVDVAALSTLGISQRTRAPVFRFQGDTESLSRSQAHETAFVSLIYKSQFSLLLQ